MLLGIAGYSNTGKTGLVVRISSALAQKGVRVITVKHAHSDDGLLSPGKDTTRHLDAGAKLSFAVSSTGMAMFSRDGSLDDVLDIAVKVFSPDVILVEGFKGSSVPKVVLGDAEAQGEIVARGNDLDRLFDVAMEYIERGIRIDKALDKLPGLDCGECGFDNCKEMAEEIADGRVDISQCQKLSSGRTKIIVDGKTISVGPFVDDIVTNTIMGMISSLKGAENPKKVSIEIVQEKPSKNDP